MPTYSDLVKKMHDLSMKPSDWQALDKMVAPDTYSKFVQAYQARENGKLPSCNAELKLCRFCQIGDGKCTFKGFCSRQFM